MYQFEVLVHHADTETGCRVGILDLHFLAPYPDGTVVGVINAEKNRHERRFARAVFSEQGVDLIVKNSQIDVVIRHHTGKYLGYSAQLYRCRFHWFLLAGYSAKKELSGILQPDSPY